MFINPGITYRLTFVTGFESLNGLYTVLKLLSHEEMLAEELSILDFYTAAGKTEDEFTADKLEYVSGAYVKIQSAIDETIVYYTSSLLLAYIPDYSAKPYNKLGLAIDIGTYRDEEELTGLTDAIKSFLTNRYGIISDPKIFAHDVKQWLTDLEYDTILADRLINKTTVVNEHMLVNQLTIENASLRAKLADLEKFLLPPVITQAVLDDADDSLHITFNKTVSRTAGIFTLTGSISGEIATAYGHGNNTNTLVYTLNTPAVPGETLTLRFVGPGVTGPTVTNDLDDVDNIPVTNNIT